MKTITDKVSATFPKGTYYIGDLCYILKPEWKEVCDLIIKEDTVLEGKFKLSDGREFFIGNTAYGDGTYQDNLGQEYPVDSGSLGLIEVRNEFDPNIKLGNLHTFFQDFTVSVEEGYFIFGAITIDTRSEEDYSDEEYEGSYDDYDSYDGE